MMARTTSPAPRPLSGQSMSGRRGFSILELLIALIIIGILAAILIPVIGRRTEQARLAGAQSDLERLADGQERFNIDVGPYYARLPLLNDTILDVGETAPEGWDRENDGVGEGTEDSINAAITGGGYFSGEWLVDASTGAMLPAGNSFSILDQIVRGGGRDYFGPYMNWQRDNNVYTSGPQVGTVGSGVAAPDGIPDDPWGNNYLLFTDEGLVLEPTGVIVASAAFPLGNPTVTTVNCQVFDRATLVSFGPNGLPGDGTGGANGLPGQGDDIVRPFGR